MAIKLILELTDSNGCVTKTIYLKGGLRKIANEFPQFTYHQLRSIYLKSNNHSTHKLQRENQALIDKMKIYDYIVNNEVAII